MTISWTSLWIGVAAVHVVYGVSFVAAMAIGQVIRRADEQAGTTQDVQDEHDRPTR